MDTNRPGQKTDTAFEYFLYAAIIAETALAIFIYKIIFRERELVHLNYYFGIFYLAFLGWSVAQLNKVHRNRKLAQVAGDAAPAQGRQKDPAVVPERARSALGLTTVQLVIVVVVFATAIATFSWALKLLR
jgi:hypothetical protein